MQIYSAKIRLGGLLHNEVRKDDLTASEIIVLRGIHGEDAVIEVKPLSGMDVKRSSKVERIRLLSLYRKEQIEKVFPTDFTALPQTLVDVDEVEDEEPDELEGIEAVDEVVKRPQPAPLVKAREALAAKRAAAAEAAKEGALA